MSTTITVTILATRTREILAATTPAMGRARFERAYRAAHGDSAPDEVHTAALWAGPDGAEAHEALCVELADAAGTRPTAAGLHRTVSRWAAEGPVAARRAA